MELDEAIIEYGGVHSRSLLKFINKCDIMVWSDLTSFNLYALRDNIIESVAPNSAKTYIAVFRSILNRFVEQEQSISREYKTILKAKGDKPVKIFLDRNELKALEQVEVKSDYERQVLATFLISAYTGCRISDARELTLDNIEDGTLRYTSQKTSITSTIPCGEKVKEWITTATTLNQDICLMVYNDTIRRLCKRAGITKRVVIFHAGKQETKKKYECVSSHTGRISFATNLSILHVPILDISRLMGHTNTAQTERYIIPVKVELTQRAMEYLTM